MVGLSMVAVFAIAAVTATSASALPEWGRCVAQPGGKYTNANCTTKGKGGSFEWQKGKTLKNVPFTGKNVGSGGVLITNANECRGGTSENRRVSRKKCEEDGGEVRELFAAESPLTVECETETNSGEASGTNLILNVNVTFTGCKALGVAPCHGAGLAEGEIKTSVLKGKLGYIAKSSKEVGVLLEPAKKHGLFAQFDCPGIFLSTAVGVGNAKEGAYYSPENHGGYDGIISPITPVNTMTSKYTQVYTVTKTAPLQNIPSHFDGKHIDVLEDYLYVTENPVESLMWSGAGEEITNENTAAEEGEIKA